MMSQNSIGRSTKEAAEKIAEKLGTKTHDVGTLKTDNELEAYDCLIFSTLTWYDGELQDDWDAYLNHLKKVNLSGKKVACFGLGDQEGYGSDFVSGMCIIYDVAITQGATTVGKMGRYRLYV